MRVMRSLHLIVSISSVFALIFLHDCRASAPYGQARPTCAINQCRPGFSCKIVGDRAVCVPTVGGRCDFPCTRIFKPVCGSDRNTYPNKCELKRAACKHNVQITVLRQGACPPRSCSALLNCAPPKACQVIKGFAKCACSRFCTLEFAPVCGSDGVTYGNLCQLRSAACVQNKKITVASQGACPKTSCAAVSCLLPKVCQVIKNRARCVCPDACIEIFDPVCGSDNKTYSNPCFLGIEKCKKNPKLTVLYRGRCVPGCEGKSCPGKQTTCHMVKGRPTCVRICRPCVGLQRNPVCGSDGKTYASKCLLKRAACKSQKKIKVVNLGPCRPKITCANVLCKIHTICKMIKGKPKCLSTCPRWCRRIYRPVCGSNGVVYANRCTMKRAACKKSKIITAVPMKRCRRHLCRNYKCSRSRPYSRCEVARGRTRCVCKFFCFGRKALVCGSDRRTYKSLCAMKKAACLRRKKITVMHRGKCVDPCRMVKCGFFAVCRVQSNNKPKCVCRRACPKILRPVCGSDGKTYNNKCLLRLASCQQKKKITIAYNGRCNPCRTVKCGFFAVCRVQSNNKPKCVCRRACPKILRPVCGSDGKTYSNKCLLRLASCQQKKKITIAYNGWCRTTVYG